MLFISIRIWSDDQEVLYLKRLVLKGKIDFIDLSPSSILFTWEGGWEAIRLGGYEASISPAWLYFGQPAWIGKL